MSQAQSRAPFLLPYLVLLLIHRSFLERNWGTLALLYHLFVPDIYDNKVALMGIFTVCLQWASLHVGLALGSELEPSVVCASGPCVF